MRTSKVRVLGRKNRSESSTRWLRRQQNDLYVQRAQAEGYRSRSAYKLSEIDDKHGLIKRGARVVDLGCAPGGWLQVATQRGARVVGMDLLLVEPVADAVILQGDFMTEAGYRALNEALGGRADVLLSDIAANATGQKLVDRLKMAAIGEAVLAACPELLKPGGATLIKLVRGVEQELSQQAKTMFAQTRLVRPDATRKESSEIYLLGTGFKGPVMQEAPSVED